MVKDHFPGYLRHAEDTLGSPGVPSSVSGGENVYYGSSIIINYPALSLPQFQVGKRYNKGLV
jgi:hypothetical protein